MPDYVPRDEILSERFSAVCRRYPAKRWWVAVSAGLDSVVLAHLAGRLLPPGTLQLVHINHQLQPQAPVWSEFCRQLASRLGLPCQVVTVTPDNASEASARAARYAAFAQLLAPDDVLLLGHHRDDQAETLLLRLLRGSGLNGLGAIPVTRPLAAGRIVRPLLGQPRQRLRHWAKTQGLTWMDDPSNQDCGYDRNFLRHQVIPLLQQRWPGAPRTFTQVSGQLRQDQALLDELLDQQLAELGATAQQLPLTGWQQWSPARQAGILRRWVACHTNRLLNLRQLSEIRQQLIDSPASSRACFPLTQTVTLRRYRHTLYLLDQLTSRTGPVLSTTLQPGCWHSPAGYLQISVSSALGSLRRDETLRLGYRQDGLRCLLAKGHKPLKKIFQEAAIPPWLRDSWPLVFHNGDVVAVAGVWISPQWQSRHGTEQPGLQLLWTPL